MSLSRALSKIEENVKVQLLAESLVNIKDKKKTQDTEITFATNEVNADSWMKGRKTAIIVWVDIDEFNAAIIAEKENVIHPINMYHFCHPLYKAKGTSDAITLELPISSNIATLHKNDVEAMARHFGLIK